MTCSDQPSTKSVLFIFTGISGPLKPLNSAGTMYALGSQPSWVGPVSDCNLSHVPWLVAAAKRNIPSAWWDSLPLTGDDGQVRRSDFERRWLPNYLIVLLVIAVNMLSIMYYSKDLFIFCSYDMLRWWYFMEKLSSTYTYVFMSVGACTASEGQWPIQIGSQSSWWGY